MKPIQRLFARSNLFLIIWSMIAAFGTYFCMYAFRKPFNAGVYAGYSIGILDYKAVLIIAQVLGYMVSKFIGIKVISELKPRHRKKLIISLILIAETALLFFGVVPAPYNFIFLFINGLPLGMVWGIIFNYLEGRRFTELLSMGLSTSLIISSGFLKTIYFELHAIFPALSEFWLPAVIGLVFLPFFLLFVWMLSMIPAPTEKDIRYRSVRLPMNKEDKRNVRRKYGWGVLGFIVIYAMLTMLRDFRDNFSVEIWSELDKGWPQDVFAKTETISGAIVLVAIGCLSAFKKSAAGFWGSFLLICLGLIIGGCSTLWFQYHWISPFWWMLSLGTGLFLAYIPIQIALFDRMIALFRIKANAGFFVYTCDSIGYLGSVGLLLYKECFDHNIGWTSMMMHFSYLQTSVSLIILIIIFLFFYRLQRRAKPYIPA